MFSLWQLPILAMTALFRRSPASTVSAVQECSDRSSAVIGNLGSYHMRLYAHHFPEKVVGMVLADGLPEKAPLKMPWPLRFRQLTDY